MTFNVVLLGPKEHQSVMIPALGMMSRHKWTWQHLLAVPLNH